MKKRWLAGLMIGIIILTGSWMGYLQYGRDMDACSSHVTSFDNYEEERLAVVINKSLRKESKVVQTKKQY